VKEKEERNIVVYSVRGTKLWQKKYMVSALHILFLTDVVVAVADF
jgi:hypothetical protein